MNDNTIKGLKGSRPGGPYLPEDCPPGGDRGKSYSATHPRTHKSWTAFDSEHMCGGA